MNEPTSPDVAGGNPTHEEILSALFANMVIQQTNMAMIFLGRVPHPETGQHVQDLETARMFIDQLEMLAVKTKGNLSKQEEGLIKQGLGAVRMAFVEAAGSEDAPPAPQAEPTVTAIAATSAPTPAPAPIQPKPAAEASAPPAEEESRKKYSKKY